MNELEGPYLDALERIKELEGKLGALTTEVVLLRSKEAEYGWQDKKKLVDEIEAQVQHRLAAESRLDAAMKRVEWYESNLTDRRNPRYDPDTVTAARETWPIVVERGGRIGYCTEPECTEPVEAGGKLYCRTHAYIKLGE
jgi:hypothetical protein